MNLIDTHCHLTMDGLNDQVEDVLERSRQAKVSSWITVGTTLAENDLCIDLANTYENLHCVVGIHPHEAAAQEAGWLHVLKQQALKPKIAALGEMGLDYYYDHSPRPVQQKVFTEQLQLARELDLPAVIHCRDAIDECLGILKEFLPFEIPVVFHCYSGTLRQARTILDRGYLISFTGIITFKKSDEIREVARYAPLDRIMLETDAPFISPEPKRSVKPNEPALMIHTAQKLAEIKALPLEPLSEQTSRNAHGFFKLG